MFIPFLNHLILIIVVCACVRLLHCQWLGRPKCSTRRRSLDDECSIYIDTQSHVVTVRVAIYYLIFDPTYRPNLGLTFLFGRSVSLSRWFSRRGEKLSHLISFLLFLISSLPMHVFFPLGLFFYESSLSIAFNLVLIIYLLSISHIGHVHMCSSLISSFKYQRTNVWLIFLSRRSCKFMKIIINFNIFYCLKIHWMINVSFTENDKLHLLWEIHRTYVQQVFITEQILSY